MSTKSGESVLNLEDTNTIITLNPASQFPTKLTSDNFPTWGAQLFTLLSGLDLLRFLDGTHPEPAATAPAAERRHWYRQYQLLLHSILASVSPDVAPYVSAATSYRQAWTILEQMFAMQSRQRIMNLKEKLLPKTQGNRPMVVYLQAMRTTAAELALVDSHVKSEDMILLSFVGFAKNAASLQKPSVPATPQLPSRIFTIVLSISKQISSQSVFPTLPL
ncbi:unnamed protein product [Linum trigynum]|uniref:Retrotransposon Copia-like N-terminal domain-containing protein n=1 Tax=Linum trigynum TaxID=586398 RepID=A0AAV2CEA4_9ROSI